MSLLEVIALMVGGFICLLIWALCKIGHASDEEIERIRQAYIERTTRPDYYDPYTHHDLDDPYDF